MKEISKIKSELSSNGYSWPPTFKDILPRVWSQMETYFDDDEQVLSALWSSFRRYEHDMIGIVFITSKRTFTIECEEANYNSNVRYLPFDSYSIEKIIYQPSASNDGLNYVSLQNDSFGNGITFGTPNRKVAEHFIETLSGKSNAIVEVLPESDDPLLANNEKEQLINPELDKVEEKFDHKFEKKHDEESPKDMEMWHKQDPFTEKEVKIRTVKAKKIKVTKDKNNDYGSRRNCKTWYFWFLAPIGFVSTVLLIVIFF